MRIHDLVEVLWEDAIAGSDSWVSPSKFKHVPHIQKSVGYFLMRDETVLVLFQTWDKEQEMVGELLRIPAGMVRKITRIRQA